MSSPQQTAPVPGQYFDVPGIPGGATQWTEQDDTAVNIVQAQNAQTAVPINGIPQYRQTDVVLDWTLCLNMSQTYTVGTSTLTPSAYAPMNAVGSVVQLIQNQYASVDVESGIDLYIFNLLRPYSQLEMNNGINNYANPAGQPLATGGGPGYLAAALAQVNNINATQWSTASTNYNLILRLPASQWFDKYYDLAVTGEPLTEAHPANVSPQFMAGTTRNITPKITLAPGNAGTTDLGPVNISAGTGSFTGSGILRIRRRAIYAGNPAVLPPIYAWQYRWKTQRFGTGGVSRFDFQVPLDTGQLMAIYLRMFDPSAAAGLGAPININTVTRFNVQYGSGLFAFDGNTIGGTTAAELMQRRWYQYHSGALPPGVMILDMGLDDLGQVTNGRALNTLTTAGILSHVDWAAPLSATAYVVMGTESLVYVT